MSDEIQDFARLRVNAPGYGLSLTAEIDFSSWLKVNPHDVAIMASVGLFPVSYSGHAPGSLPTFVVKLSGKPKDPLLALQTIKSHIESIYDRSLDEQLLR